MDSSIKNWYVEKYPTDDLGQEIPENLTFYDVYEALEFRQSVYALLGGADDNSGKNFWKISRINALLLSRNLRQMARMQRINKK